MMDYLPPADTLYGGDLLWPLVRVNRSVDLDDQHLMASSSNGVDSLEVAPVLVAPSKRFTTQVDYRGKRGDIPS